MREIVDEDKCRRCGGRCCRIYSRALLGDVSEQAFEEWVLDWDAEFEALKAYRHAEANFKPTVVFLNCNQWMLGDLVARGIDPYSCQYLGKDGCMLPRENRPPRCREYMCEGIPEDPSVPASEISTIGAICYAEGEEHGGLDG